MTGDIIYYYQELQQPDAKQFANAIVKEVNGHVDNKHWILVNSLTAKTVLVGEKLIATYSIST